MKIRMITLLLLSSLVTASIFAGPEVHFLEPITEFSSEQGLKYWLQGEPDEGEYNWPKDGGQPIYTPPKQTIYIVVSWKQDKAWLKIDGNQIALPLTSSKNVPDMATPLKAGDKFTRTFSDGKVTAVVNYEVELIGEADDCEKHYINASLEVSKGGSKESKSIRNVHGC